MKFKNNKCIEITPTAYAVVKITYQNSTCLADAVDKLSAEYDIDKDMAFNLLMAVVNDYKYLKVVRK